VAREGRGLSAAGRGARNPVGGGGWSRDLLIQSSEGREREETSEKRARKVSRKERGGENYGLV